jgi:hypothetical protein
MNDSTGQPTLPELHDALLDAATVEQLFQDLAACARISEILPKFSRREMVREAGTPLSLEEARELLMSGRVRGLQIRYRYQDADWWDTLMRQPEGVRIVRIRHEFSES